MNYNNKKGQAAMEFLMTYGWAILAAIVVIAVLAIYFRPSSIVSNTAVVSAPFYVNAFNLVASNDNVTLDLKNNGGEDLTGVHLSIALTQPSGVTCTPTGVPKTMTAASTTLISVVCSGAPGLSSGDAVSGTLTITYMRPGSTLNLTSSGSITGKVP